MTWIAPVSDAFEYRCVEYRDFDQENVQEKLRALVADGWESDGDPVVRAGSMVDMYMQQLRRPFNKITGAAMGLLANTEADASMTDEQSYLLSDPENAMLRLFDNIIELDGVEDGLIEAAEHVAEELGVTFKQFIIDAVKVRVALHKEVFDSEAVEDLVCDITPNNVHDEIDP